MDLGSNVSSPNTARPTSGPRAHYTELSVPAEAWWRGAGPQIALGLTLNLIGWRMAWSGPDAIRFHAFTPLWLGYILTVDGICRLLVGSSLLSRLGVRSAWLFAISIPLWWLFEAVNARLGNWSYVTPRDYGWLAHHVEASLAFSTVVPAIFVTAELVRAVAMRRPVRWISLNPDRRQLIAISAAGAAAFAAILAYPDILFPLIWLSLYFAIDPILVLIGGRSLASQVRRGRWDSVIVLAAAALLCGFFWELWNSRSLPKWTYDIGYAEWFRIFEMPVLGYGGYIPFGLEVYAIVCLVDRLLGIGLGSAFRFDRAPED
jgi:hypothetical protein